MDYFSQHFFSDPEKKSLDYSLWFLQDFDETMTAGYFLGGGKGRNLPPPLDCCLPHFRLAVIIIFQKILYTPKTPLPPARTPILVPPFKISLENTLTAVIITDL